MSTSPSPGVGSGNSSTWGGFPGSRSTAARMVVSLDPGIGLASEELAGAGAADEFAGINDGAAARENGFGCAFNLDPLEHGIVHAHVVRVGTDDLFVVWIEEDEVRVRADGDGAFARVKAKKFCGCGRNELDEAVGREMPTVNPAGVNEAQPVLDARTTVGNFGEVVLAQLFLLFEAERAVVGGNNLQRVFREALPELFLMPFLAERRRENILRALEPGNLHIFEREVQIPRTSFRISRKSAVARFANFFKRVVAGEVNDVNGRACHFGERDGTRGSFGFGCGGASERVILGRAFAFSENLLDDHVDGAAIFRVHADEPVVRGRLSHGPKDGGIVKHEHAWIRHEELEAGDAVADKLAHLFELRGAEIGDDAVEGVVGDGLVMRLFHPGVEGLAERLAFVLDGEVNERSRAAKSCRDGARLEVVRAGGAAKGHV